MSEFRILRPLLTIALVAGLSVAAGFAADTGEVSLSVGRSFLEQLDLDGFRAAAVQEDGRIKTVESLAREKLKYVSPGGLDDVDPVAWYLDMILTPEHYQGAKIIRIKSKALRARIVQGIRSLAPAAERTGVISPAELDSVASNGRVSPSFLDHPTVQTVLNQLERDLRGTGKAVQQVRSARALTRPGVLGSLMKVIPPPGGSEKDPWIPLQAVSSGRAAPRDDVHAGMGLGDASGLPAETAAQLGKSWNELSRGWRFQETSAVNEALAGLTAGLARVNPELYPERSRLEWELWYYRNKKLTGGWLIYFFAIPLLLMGFIYGFRWARWAGLGLFSLAFVIHTFSIGLRWWLAGRIPNANMFEAIIASAWFGGVTALVLEWALRRQRLRLLPALSASAYAMVAMMFGRFMTVKLNSDITTVMPVLDRTIWLYIHTNIVIASYALIFFAAVTATLYLVFRGMHSWAPRVLGGDWGRYAYAQGGASSVILGRPTQPMNQGLARTLDGATMIFLEVAFLSLWVGTILGAVWADVSWGRPWGWDPKEVFAFNTWLVFLVLVHVRLKVRDKALWTAVLALIGCAVMIFNWVAVNFVIVGLHSYA